MDYNKILQIVKDMIGTDCNYKKEFYFQVNKKDRTIIIQGIGEGIFKESWELIKKRLIEDENTKKIVKEEWRQYAISLIKILEEEGFKFIIKSLSFEGFVLIED